VDREPRSTVRPKKGARDRLIGLAESNPEWALGFLDETWWSRFERPALHGWSEEGRPLRLVEQTPVKDDPDPKALAAYGMLVRSKSSDPRGWEQRVWLRFVEGRPVSPITTQFLGWCCDELAAEGKKALLLVWDNASWHKSKLVKGWIASHNRQVRETGLGVRIVVCFLPKKSPWLNPIEPMWIHAKRKVVEPEGLLGAYELADRVCRVFGCPHYEHLAIPQEVA
jgi:hypothetical protein